MEGVEELRGVEVCIARLHGAVSAQEDDLFSWQSAHEMVVDCLLDPVGRGQDCPLLGVTLLQEPLFKIGVDDLAKLLHIFLQLRVVDLIAPLGRQSDLLL